jgi:hypothetical protein
MSLPMLASAQRQHLIEAAAGVEVFLAEHPRCPAAVLIVRINSSHTGASLLENNS